MIGRHHDRDCPCDSCRAYYSTKVAAVTTAGLAALMLAVLWWL